jgi:hypothetical protein
VTRGRHWAVGALAATGIALASFFVRAPSLDRAFTIDEKLWIERSDRFVGAVLDGRFRDAISTGHPGVTTMWVGGLAQLTLSDEADLRARYARARVWMAALASALIVLVAWLTRILAGDIAGGLTGLLLALDPFLLAHNRVLHLDGLLSLLVASSFLALLAATRAGRPRLLVLSGALAGLAALTKQPAVVLAGAAALTIRLGGGGARRFARWLAPAAVVFFILWPVLWVRPWHAVAIMAGGGGAAITESHSGGFFLGRQVGNPGPLFYWVVLAFRTSAVTLPAAVVAVVWAIRRRKVDASARVVASLLALALGFLVFMTIAPKKGDRYLLPAIAVLDVAIAVTAAYAATKLLRRGDGRRPAARAAAAAMIAIAVLALHGAPAMSLSPYQNAAFNPLLGGARAARHALVVGWGEGLDEAAEHLSRLPEAERLTVAVSRVTQFEDFFVGRTVPIEDSALHRPDGVQADLVLFYLSSVQVGRFADLWARYRDREPLYTLEIAGVPYVRVFAAAA